MWTKTRQSLEKQEVDDDDDDDDDDPSSMITMVGAEPGEGHTEHGMSELQGLTIFFSVCECKPSF